MQSVGTSMSAIRMPAAVLALACLFVAASGAAAASGRRSLTELRPTTQQFIQFTLFLRGNCSATLAAKPILPNLLRVAAIADVQMQLRAKPIGSANLSATLESVRAYRSYCEPATVRPAVPSGRPLRKRGRAVDDACVTGGGGMPLRNSPLGAHRQAVLFPHSMAAAALASTCTHRIQRPCSPCPPSS